MKKKGMTISLAVILILEIAAIVLLLHKCRADRLAFQERYAAREELETEPWSEESSQTELVEAILDETEAPQVLLQVPVTEATDMGGNETGKETEMDLKKQAEEIVAAMSLEEKIAQMFIITPDALTGVTGANYAGQVTEQCFQSYPVGGLVFFESNILSEEQIQTMTSSLQRISLSYTGLPLFLGVDEEGGRVARIAGRGILDAPVFDSMYSIGMSGDSARAYQAGKEIASYVREAGFNVDFAPVADIWSNPANTVIGDRSFGTEAGTVSEMVSAMVTGMTEEKILSVVKHFPGHGNTDEDSHSGAVYSWRTLEELEAEEFLPFQAGIQAGADMVMVGHISLPECLGNDAPASLSYEAVSGILRGKLDFEGLVVTDALNMGAISNRYSSGEAAVRAVQAGVDILMMPQDFYGAYESLLNAVSQDEISEERIGESVTRIVEKKLEILE